MQGRIQDLGVCEGLMLLEEGSEGYRPIRSTASSKKKDRDGDDDMKNSRIMQQYLMVEALWSFQFPDFRC